MANDIGPQSRVILRLVTSVSKQAESYLLTSTHLASEVEQQLKQLYAVNIVYLPELSTHNPVQIWKSHKALTNAVLSIQPDIVHVHGAWNPLLFLMERTARKNGFVTTISTYGGMAPEILNIDFFKKKLLPFLFYQAPLIRHATSLIAMNEKEWNDISNLNLKKRVEILPQMPAGGEMADVFASALLSAYRKAIDSSYRRFITTEEEMIVEQCITAATTADAYTPDATIDWGTASFRRIFFFAYDEDVLDSLPQGAKNLGKNIPPLINVTDIPRYVDRKAKCRGSLQQLQLPKRYIRLDATHEVERHVVLSFLRAHHEGYKHLTLRHKAELYYLFRKVDFDEYIVSQELSRLHLKAFTIKIQKMLHTMYAMPEGYDIF